MEVLEKQLFDSVTLTVDGHSFVHCTLINCELRYSGGEFEMVHTLVSDCRWAFGGAARRTMEVLETFNVFGEDLDGPESTLTPSFCSEVVNGTPQQNGSNAVKRRIWLRVLSCPRSPVNAGHGIEMVSGREALWVEKLWAPGREVLAMRVLGRRKQIINTGSMAIATLYGVFAAAQSAQGAPKQQIEGGSRGSKAHASRVLFTRISQKSDKNE